MIFRLPLSSMGPWPLGRFVAALVVVSSIGCTSAHSPGAAAMDEAAVLGTWAYTTRGISELQEGTFRVTTQEDRLVVQLQDEWRGSVRGRVYVNGPRVEIRLNQIQITGRITKDRLTASVQREPWDVSRSHRRRSSGSLVARRIDSPMDSGNTRDLDCPPLLRESSHACSPLRFE